MFWMFVKTTLLALYVLAGLGVIVMNLTLRHDLKRYIKKEGIKFEPYPLSEKVASKIKYVIGIFLPYLESYYVLGYGFLPRKNLKRCD